MRKVKFSIIRIFYFRYGVQVVYNTKKWDKVANSKSFKAETTGVRGRPCISGLFKRRTDGKVGMVTSCHIDHCG